MSDGIEKLQECAYDMDQMQCDDVLVLSAQIEREHEEELQALKKRYKTDLREARESRDIAIKEASKLRNDKRLMPPGMEWPKDRNENPFDPRKLYDRGCGAVDSVRIGFVNGKQWARVVSHDGIDLSPEELDACEPEVLGADGVPIEADHAQPDTQKHIDSAIIAQWRDNVCPQHEPYTREYCTNECECNSCFAERVMEQCDRQRELCAKGGE